MKSLPEFEGGNNVILISAGQTHGVIITNGPAQTAITRGSVIHARKLVTTAKCSTFELIRYEFILSKRLIFTF